MTDWTVVNTDANGAEDGSRPTGAKRVIRVHLFVDKENFFWPSFTEHNGSYTETMARNLSVPHIALTLKVPVDNRGAVKVLTHKLKPATYHPVSLRLQAGEFDLAYRVLSEEQVKGLEKVGWKHGPAMRVNIRIRPGAAGETGTAAAAWTASNGRPRHATYSRTCWQAEQPCLR